MTEFERIYEKNYTTVYRYILSLCRDPSLAEEIAQEAFVKALEHISISLTADASCMSGSARLRRTPILLIRRNRSDLSAISRYRYIWKLDRRSSSLTRNPPSDFMYYWISSRSHIGRYFPCGYSVICHFLKSPPSIQRQTAGPG